MSDMQFFKGLFSMEGFRSRPDVIGLIWMWQIICSVTFLLFIVI